MRSPVVFVECCRQFGVQNGQKELKFQQVGVVFVTSLNKEQIIILLLFIIVCNNNEYSFTVLKANLCLLLMSW